MIEVTGLSKRYGAFLAVNNVSFSIEKGEIILIGYLHQHIRDVYARNVFIDDLRDLSAHTYEFIYGNYAGKQQNRCYHDKTGKYLFTNTHNAIAIRLRAKVQNLYLLVKLSCGRGKSRRSKRQRRI